MAPGPGPREKDLEKLAWTWTRREVMAGWRSGAARARGWEAAWGASEGRRWETGSLWGVCGRTGPSSHWPSSSGRHHLRAARRSGPARAPLAGRRPGKIQTRLHPCSCVRRGRRRLLKAFQTRLEHSNLNVCSVNPPRTTAEAHGHPRPCWMWRLPPPSVLQISF